MELAVAGAGLATVGAKHHEIASDNAVGGMHAGELAPPVDVNITRGPMLDTQPGGGLGHTVDPLALDVGPNNFVFGLRLQVAAASGLLPLGGREDPSPPPHPGFFPFPFAGSGELGVRETAAGPAEGAGVG